MDFSHIDCFEYNFGYGKIRNKNPDAGIAQLVERRITGPLIAFLNHLYIKELQNDKIR